MKQPLMCLLYIALPLLPTVAWAAAGAPGHSHEQYVFGKPGDPKKPARVIGVTMREGDGRMSFEPERVEIRQGDQIRFRLVNGGELKHEFMLGTVEDNAKHAAIMQKFPEMEHDDGNGKTLEKGNKADLVWLFDKPGTFEFACLQPGHYEAGMKGTIVVLPRKSKSDQNSKDRS